MFPAGPVGLALLILRLTVVGTLLINISEFGVLGSSMFRVFVVATLTIILCLGLLTPIACIGAILLQLTALRPSTLQTNMDIFLHVLTTISLLFLGPGACSADARLFGRRLILRPPK
jgi:hypothetical protein